MTAGRIPAGSFPYEPGSGVRAWGRSGVPALFAVTVRDAAAFLACCRAHAASGRGSGHFPVRSDVEGMTPAEPPLSCPPGPGFLGGTQVAIRFGVAYSTVTGWAGDGRLTSYAHPYDTRRRLYDPAEVEALLRGKAAR